MKCVKRESEITPSWVGLKPVVKSSSNSMTTRLIHPIRRPGLWQELLNSLAIPVSIKWLDISIKSLNGPRFASSFPHLMSFQMIMSHVKFKVRLVQHLLFHLRRRVSIKTYLAWWWGVSTWQWEILGFLPERGFLSRLIPWKGLYVWKFYTVFFMINCESR